PHWPALLGYALSEGSLGYDSHFYLYSTVAAELDDMARIVASYGNTSAHLEARSKPKASSIRPVRIDRRVPSEAVTFLFQDCGLQGKIATNKRVPPIVDRWDREAVAVLVAKLFQGDGCVHPKTQSIYYATSSEGLAGDVRRLLLKLGIPSTIHRKSFAYRGERRIGYTVNLIGGRRACARFAELVGGHLVDSKRMALEAMAAAYAGTRALLARGTVDIVPVLVCREPLREAILKRYATLKAGCRALGLSYRLVAHDRVKRGIRRDTLEYIAERLDSPALQSLVDPAMAWSRTRRFVLQDVEPTYDFEVACTHSFIANGIAVHNSHAAAYGLVAYQTAYFKANYPVEFMAALLTSEMGDTDKIVKYIEECRAMGIRVEPPDVNVSAVQFSVAGETVRFGLAAIKNVGEAAMQSILKSRSAEGAFQTLEDFCTRVDLRLVNRRVVESLIKAGAFDSLGLPRAHLLTTTDMALESGQRQQRDRAEGQGSFFEMIPAAAPVRASAPVEVTPEWEADQRLAFEKEVLGFYISGHPLARYRAVVEPLGVTTSADLAAKGHGARVLLFGHANALKETSTKGGNRMAFFTLEDMEGTVDVTVFPEPFKSAASHLRSGEAVLVRGRVDDGDKGRVVLAEDVRLLEQALADSSGRARPGGGASEPNACRIRVTPGDDPSATLAAVRQLCGEHPGRVPVFLHLVLGAQEVVVRTRGLSVDGSRELVADGETVLGPGAVSVDYAGRA
ncbi:MAG: LAGLIDADG family homing endonuclease, partial [Candidatus Rokuibacteriota bacterium]